MMKKVLWWTLAAAIFVAAGASFCIGGLSLVALCDWAINGEHLALGIGNTTMLASLLVFVWPFKIAFLAAEAKAKSCYGAAA